MDVRFFLLELLADIFEVPQQKGKLSITAGAIFRYLKPSFGYRFLAALWIHGEAPRLDIDWSSADVDYWMQIWYPRQWIWRCSIKSSGKRHEVYGCRPSLISFEAKYWASSCCNFGRGWAYPRRIGSRSGDRALASRLWDEAAQDCGSSSWLSTRKNHLSSTGGYLATILILVEFITDIIKWWITWRSEMRSLANLRMWWTGRTMRLHASL